MAVTYCADTVVGAQVRVPFLASGPPMELIGYTSNMAGFSPHFETVTMTKEVFEYRQERGLPLIEE